MPSVLPRGDAAPSDGRLPSVNLERARDQPFGVYVHVPFCTTRCGYCDFNTYTAAELGPGVSRASYAETVVAEVALARRVLGSGTGPVSTVFVGGGTPTLLDPADLARMLEAVSPNPVSTASSILARSAGSSSVG